MDPQTQAGGALGRTLGGRYELRRVLGVGGMGTVYAAMHAFTQRRVAVKVLHRSVVQAVPTIGVRFLREAQAAASIDHPGIVDVLDAGQDDETGDLYLVLELLEGEDLDRALQSGRLTPTDVVRIVADVLEPLAAAHDKGFVHRDIKPANIFLLDGPGEARQVKLLDFGIVKPQHQADITMSGALVGTIDYMSPEQVRGEGVGPSVDLWALAATLFHALAGRPPVVAPTASSCCGGWVSGSRRRCSSSRRPRRWRWRGWWTARSRCASRTAIRTRSRCRSPCARPSRRCGARPRR